MWAALVREKKDSTTGAYPMCNWDVWQRLAYPANTFCANRVSQT